MTENSELPSPESERDSQLPQPVDKLVDAMTPLMDAGIVREELAILLMHEAWQENWAAEYAQALLERKPQTEREVWNLLQEILPDEEVPMAEKWYKARSST